MTLSLMYIAYYKEEHNDFPKKQRLYVAFYQIMIITTTIKITYGQFVEIY